MDGRDRPTGQRHLLRYGAVLGLLAAGLISGAPPALAVNGDATTDPALSFVAKVSFGDVGACTGSLIDAWWILTATSCFSDGTAPVVAGAPSRPTRVTVGRFDLTTTAGAARTVTRLVPHPDRNVVLAELSAAVTDIAPVKIGSAPPQSDETLLTPGYGRTATEWVPDHLHAAQFTVSAVRAAAVDLAPKSDAATLCKGDAGGPALRSGGASFQLVAVQDASWQNGCLGEHETRSGATSTRVDDLQPWIDATLPRFETGFETADPRPHWQNTVGSGKTSNVGGVCCGLTGAELKTSPEVAHSGATSLLYSGADKSATSSYAYLKAFDLSSAVVTPGTVLSYWIFPQGSESNPIVSGDNSTCVAVDMTFDDGTSLRDTAATDQRGNRIHPRSQCGHLTLDSWNQVIVPVGAVADGRRITELSVAYDQPANTGNYRGYIDDVSIRNVHTVAQLDTGLEAGQTQLTWTNTIEIGGAVHGGTTNISGICCGLTGAELKLSGERGHDQPRSLLYSGLDTSATTSYTYLKGIALTHSFVTPTTVLSYWIFPQSSALSSAVTGVSSTCVAVDLIFADRIAGTEKNLRDTAATDQRGNRVHPQTQCAKLTLDTWNNVTVPLGAVANGLEITELNVGYDQPAGTGGFRGYIDDIRIGNS